MRILIACEFSEIVKEQFLLLGHDAHSCDFLAGEKRLPNHHQGDVLALLQERWDMMIAFPPCTYLANSGVRWLRNNPSRLKAVETASIFFNHLLNADIERIAIENPIQHKYARAFIRKPDQIVQPWMFGHGETKATCLWLKNLPLLWPTWIVSARYPRIHLEPPGPDRLKNRSRTYQGIAEAMAKQWGIY